MEGEEAADPCAICLGDVGRGQAIFTAECSHVFHNCSISASVAYGHRDCPLCKATWRDLPAVGGPVVPRPPRPARPSSSHGRVVRRPPPPPARPSSSHGPYDDDEPVVEQSVEAVQDESRAADHAVVALRTHCERPAVAGGASRVSFAVLVTVIDLSGSMRGQKLYLVVKQAVGFVIGNLGPADRLSVVSFSNDATSVVQLARMTADGKASAKRAVEALVASGGTNIGEGLRVAARVLDDRRYGNAVTSMILLSDGRDGYVRCRHADLVPPSVRCYHAGLPMGRGP
jgi:hypothetical protein